MSCQSEKGVETHDVVEEEGRQEGCGHLGVRWTMLSVSIKRAEGPRILETFLIRHK